MENIAATIDAPVSVKRTISGNESKGVGKCPRFLKISKFKAIPIAGNVMPAITPHDLTNIDSGECEALIMEMIITAINSK